MKIGNLSHSRLKSRATPVFNMQEGAALALLGFIEFLALNMLRETAADLTKRKPWKQQG